MIVIHLSHFFSLYNGTNCPFLRIPLLNRNFLCLHECIIFLLYFRDLFLTVFRSRYIYLLRNVIFLVILFFPYVLLRMFFYPIYFWINIHFRKNHCLLFWFRFFRLLLGGNSLKNIFDRILFFACLFSLR